MSELRRDDQELADPPALTDPPFIDSDGDIELPDARTSGGRGTVITLISVIAVLLATALTVLGLGAADTAVANFDASSWLWSSDRSEVDRVNGVTARVDTRTKISDSQNHQIQITQTDKYLMLRDLETGQVTALDLTTLQVSAVMPTTPGFGVSVALHGESAFVVDSVLGQVRQLDPRTLVPTGDAVVLPKGLTPGDFDGTGLLWIAVPTEGTVVAIEPGKDGASPHVQRTVTVASPGHDFELSALDSGVAVLDNTEQKLTIITDKVQSVAVPVNKPGVMPARTVGSPIVVTVADDRRVFVVDGTRVNQFTVAGDGPIGPAVQYAGRVYAPDTRAGVVHETDLRGSAFNDITMPTSNGTVELEVREGYLFINAPDGPNARVVDDKHVVREVNKYQDGVLGGDPPPPPPAPPPPPVDVPGPPQNLTSAAGNGSATITWRKAADNGAPVTKYVVEGNGQQIVVGASQRSVEITGLTNGQTYRFSVYAVNAQGAGPRAYAPPVTPTSDVPDPPASVSATANPDGTVTVGWPAANGQGHQITSYRVTSITGGVQAPVGAVTATTMVIAKGALKLGTQYAFTVVAINDINAASAPSPVSNVAIPFTVPGAPVNLTAGPVPTQRGAIQVTWKAAASNGRPITKYVVESPKGTTSVTGTSVTLTGFADDTAVPVKVHAVNAAGDGPDATATGRTIGVPTVTVTGQSAGYNGISVTFTPNNKGGAATCTLSIDGSAASSVSCTTQPVTLSAGGLYPNESHTYSVKITSPVGSASASGSISTAVMRFTVICPNNANGYCNGGIWAYSDASQQSTAIVALPVGKTEVAVCYKNGNKTINATPWGAKNSSMWIGFIRNGTQIYFPWAWSTLDGGDNYQLLRPC